MAAPGGPIQALDIHPVHEGDRYTMVGLFRTLAEADRAAVRASSRKTVLRFTTIAPSGSTLFAVAGREPAVRQRRARIPHDRTVPWQAVRIALEAFRKAEEGSKTRGRPLRWYKSLEEDKLRTIMAGYDWTGSRLEVAARIVSDTVLAHPFPNANHRTSTSIARTYLASEGIDWPPYELRGRGIDRFIRETDPHIHQSKYWLQLRRRPAMVGLAHAEGYTHLELKPGVTIPIGPNDYNLTQPQLAAKHLAVFENMIRTIDGGANAAELAAPNRHSMREVVAWYFA